MTSAKLRTALVVGAGSALGAEIAQELARQGAVVTALDSEEQGLQELGAKLARLKTGSRSMVVETEQDAQVKSAVDTVLDSWGRLDILINAADFPCQGEVDSLAPQEWDAALGRNLKSMFLFSREAVPKMKEAKYGRIVNLGSIAWLGWPKQSSYAASQSAIFGFNRSLALELASFGVTVNLVVKGDLSSPGVEMPQEEIERMSARIPLQKLGAPADVARAVGFLASEQAKYITGQTLFVCGGRSIHYSMSV